MSDAGRESITDKFTAAVKPDSEKTTTEHMGDKLIGKTDKAASALEPQSEKSNTQKAVDSMTSNTKDESLLEKTKHAVGLGK